MFVDVAKIYVKAGDGGNGAVAFLRKSTDPLAVLRVETVERVETL